MRCHDRPGFFPAADAPIFDPTAFGSMTPNQDGSAPVSPTQTTAYGGTVTGAGGASGSCPAALTVQCTPATTYSCSGDDVVQTSTSSACVVTTTTPYATCNSPAYCSTGSAACLYPPPASVPDAPNNLTGHLQARPSIVQKGKTTKLYWNIANVSSCSVMGTNSDGWTGTTSGTSGKTSSAINQQTVYTLACNALDGSRRAACRFKCVVEVRKYCASLAEESAAALGQLNTARLAAK